MAAPSNPYETDAMPSPTDLWSVDPNTPVEEWLETHDPLDTDELAAVAETFVSSVGESARAESDEGVAEDAYLRVADADDFGRFAMEADVVLLEPGHDGLEPTYGYLFGYTTEGNSAEEVGVPLLVCLPGPLADAVEWLEEFSAAIADMPGLGIVRP